MNFLHIQRKFAFIFLAFLCPISPGNDLSASPDHESGLPHIQTCLPGTYINVNHYNSIVQGSDGFIYIGTRNGILRYNSQNWKLIPASGHIRLLRHLEYIIAYSKNQLYIIPPTHKIEFGFPASLFPSGENKLSGNILQVLSCNENLFILTSTGLFLKSYNIVSEISTPSRVIRIFPSGEGTVLLTEENQYYSHDGEQIQALGLPGELNSLSDLLPHPEKSLYVNGSGKDLILCTKGEIPVTLKESARFLSEFGYRSAAWLSNGSLAIGTNHGGIILASAEGEITGRISMHDGLYSNEVIKILCDEANNLWALHEHAVSRIEMPSPYSSFMKENGLEGNIRDLLRHDGFLYAASSQGLFRLIPASKTFLPSSPNPAFQKIQGTDADFRCLESTPRGILAGSSAGLYEVNNENTRLVFRGAVNSLLYIHELNILLAGTDVGLTIFNLENWEEIKNFSLPKISIDDIALSPDNVLWLSSRSGTLSRSAQSFSDPGRLAFESYTSEQLNSPQGSYIDLIRTSERLYFSTHMGLLEFDPVSGSFYPDTIMTFPFQPGTYRVSIIQENKEEQVARNEKNLWIHIELPDHKLVNSCIGRQISGGSSEFQPLTYLRLNERIINCLYAESGGILWMGTQKGVLRYDPSSGTGVQPVSHTYITEVLSGGTGDMEKISLELPGATEENGRVSPDLSHGTEKPGRSKIPYAKNNIRFTLLSTDYNSESSPRFRYILTGVNDEWTDWNDDNSVEFKGLKRGWYEFRVQSQDIYGFEARADTFNFSIKAPVFAAWYAVLFYSLVILILIFFLQKWINLRQIKEQFHLEEVVQKRTESIIKEKDKAEDLLANILPKTTADELKAGGKATSNKFKMCSVLFADIQGFTKIAEEMNPDKLIDQLDRFYYHFDSVVEKYNIEKIKTIGDAYMAAGGIPIKNRTNPVDVVLAALEMQQYMKGLKESQSDIWDLRIGIHTGSVIAGVVGQKKYSYDIWGDTVNTASRMESSGEVGKVNISATTYKLIKDFFQCEFRGKMPVKYKGDIAMFFVNGLNPAYSKADRITPNEKFNVQIQLLRLLDLEEVILEKLKNELPEDLFFHNVEHTSHVYAQVELLGRGEHVSDEDLLLLQTAALLHDTGYIQGMEDHELRSVEFAKEILPLYRYSEQQIAQICRLILATGLPPKPENLLEQIICDANLDHLGRVDFLIQSDKLFQEYRMKHKIRSKKEWNQYQIDFLESHEFYTSIANRMREVPKEQQIENIRQFS